MANYWSRKGWEVTLLTFDDGSEPPFYPLDPGVQHTALGVAGASTGAIDGWRQNLRRARVLRAAIGRSAPDVVVSFADQTNVLTLLSTLGLGLPVLVSERVDPAHQPLGRLWRLLRQRLYPTAAGVVLQTESVREYFTPPIRARARVIPNPVVLPSGLGHVPVEETSDGDLKRIMAMGRLTEQKGFDTLIRAFAAVSPRHPDWRLEIWGDGPLSDRLRQLVVELDLDNCAHLPGKTQKPFDQMRKSDLFVLSSRYEGFPNVLCEAMACGLPVISFDCPSGPGEIIRDEVDGLLVPPQDAGALAAAMERMMGDAALRDRLGSRAPEIRERFGLERVMAMWEELVEEARHGNRCRRYRIRRSGDRSLSGGPGSSSDLCRQ